MLKPHEWDQLDPGPHTVIVRIKASVSLGLQTGAVGQAIISFSIELRTNWEWIDSDQPTVQPIDDKSHQAAVQQSVTI